MYRKIGFVSILVFFLFIAMWGAYYFEYSDLPSNDYTFTLDSNKYFDDLIYQFDIPNEKGVLKFNLRDIDTVMTAKFKTQRNNSFLKAIVIDCSWNGTFCNTADYIISDESNKNFNVYKIQPKKKRIEIPLKGEIIPNGKFIFDAGNAYPALMLDGDYKEGAFLELNLGDYICDHDICHDATRRNKNIRFMFFDNSLFVGVMWIQKEEGDGGWDRVGERYFYLNYNKQHRKWVPFTFVIVATLFMSLIVASIKPYLEKKSII